MDTNNKNKKIKNQKMIIYKKSIHMQKISLQIWKNVIHI